MSLLTNDLYCYLVGWDDEYVIKAGITHHHRWSTFVSRGARLIQVHRRTPVDDIHLGGWLLEQDMLAHLQTKLGLPLAFESRADANRLIGSRGGGWTECRRAASFGQYVDALASCVSIMHSHGREHCSEDVRSLMHGRTDARTYGDAQITNAADIKFCNARGGKG